jgi:hypothetical protein
MRKRVFLTAVLASLALGIGAFAQEGHPLTGSWHGDWGTSPAQRNRVTMSMQWDTKNIVGKINPGPNSIPLKVATLDASKWMVHFEADGKDQAGAAVHIVIDGKLDNIGSYNRTITGTWMQGSTKADFKLTRD